MKQRQGSVLVIVIIVVAMAAIGGLAYYALRPKPVASTSVTPVASVSKTPEAAKDPYEGWKTLPLGVGSLKIQYPADWEIEPGTVTSILKAPVRNGYNNYRFRLAITKFVQPADTVSSQDGNIVKTEKITVKNGKDTSFATSILWADCCIYDSGYVNRMYLASGGADSAAYKPGRTSINPRFFSYDGAEPEIFSFAASLLPDNAQNNGGVKQEEFVGHPDYAVVQKIYQSISY